MKKRILLLGSTGMLGHMTAEVLRKETSFEVLATARHASKDALAFDFTERDAFTKLLGSTGAVDYIINCIGVIKPLIKDDDNAQVKNAIRGNSLLPLAIAEALANTQTQVLQIATDCVYSGAKGSYIESDVHDATDVYGKTKSLGEVHAPNYHHLRCSIIGPELTGFRSLIEWFRKQPQGAQLKGFTNHLWNGVTTKAFAHLCVGIISAELKLPHSVHIIPADRITKDALVRCFAKTFKREDLAIEAVQAPTVIDRTLCTTQADLNTAIWSASKYEKAPAICEMVAELA